MEVIEDYTVHAQNPLDKMVKLDTNNLLKLLLLPFFFFLFVIALMYFEHTGYLRTVYSYW